MAGAALAPEPGEQGMEQILYSQCQRGHSLEKAHRPQEGDGIDQEHAEMLSLEWFVP